MKKKLIFAISIMLLKSIFSYGQEGITINGYFQADHRIKPDTGLWLWNENRLSLKPTKIFEEKAKFTSDIWIRTIGQLNSVNLIPEIREAKIEVYNFLIDKLDLTIGRQRIKWGTADKINPTDNINPLDMEDIWDFGRHKPSDAIMLRYYPHETFRIEAVFVPLYSEPIFPIGQYSNLFIPAKFNFPDSFSISQKPGAPLLPLPKKVAVIIDTVTFSTTIPDLNINRNSSYGFKLSKNLLGWDISASYSYGRDNIPVPYLAQVSIDSINTTKNRNYVSIHSKLRYPSLHRIGFDFAGNLFGVGLWGEACLSISEFTYTMKTDMPDVNKYIKQKFNLFFDPGIINPVIADSVVLDKTKSWLKYVIGMDYTFKNGIYTNFQYVHGFLHERKNEDLNDYFILRAEKKFFNDKLKLAPISGAVAIDDFSDYKNNYSIFYIPEILYNPNDNTEIAIGVKLIDGKGNNPFTKLKDFDEVFLRVKYSF